MAHGPEGCEVDPEYDPNKCGFSSPMFKEGCADINGCGDPYGARAFHFSFQIVCGFVMLNLIIFYVLDSFKNMNMSVHHGLDMDDHTLLLEVWLRFDQNCVGHIDLERLIDMLRTLPAPMGFGVEEPKEGSNVYLAKNSKQFVKILDAEQAAVPEMDTYGNLPSRALCACKCCCGTDNRLSKVVHHHAGDHHHAGEHISRATNVKISRRQVLKQIVHVLRIPAVPSLKFSRGVYLLCVLAAQQSRSRAAALSQPPAFAQANALALCSPPLFLPRSPPVAHQRPPLHTSCLKHCFSFCPRLPTRSLQLRRRRRRRESCRATVGPRPRR